MYRVIITAGRDKPVERVFVAPHDVRQFVQHICRENVDTQRMTERMLCMLHRKGGSIEEDGLTITWE